MGGPFGIRQPAIGRPNVFGTGPVGNNDENKPVRPNDDGDLPAKGGLPQAEPPARSSRAIVSLLEKSIRDGGIALSGKELKAAVPGTKKQVKNELQTLEPLRQAAESALGELDKLTGRKLADFATDADVLKSVRKAIDAQMDLADALMAAAKRTGSERLMELSTAANLRACEISRLVGELKMCADNDADSPKWNLEETGNVNRLAEVAVRSHGTMEALAQQADFDALFAELARLEDPKSGARGADAVAKVALLVAKCETALAETRGSFTDKSAVDGLARRLSEAKARFKDFRPHVLNKLAQRFIDSWSLPSSCTAYVAKPNADKRVVAAIDKLKSRLDAYKDAEKKYALTPTEKVLSRAVSAFDQFVSQLDKLVHLCLSEPAIDLELYPRVLMTELSHSHYMLESLIGYRATRAKFEFAPSDVLAVLQDRAEFSSLVSTAAYGYGLERSDPELVGKECVEKKNIGSGSFNSVDLCTFKGADGTTRKRVFKGEMGAWTSVRRGIVSFVGDFADKNGQRGVDSNFASHDLAELMGCGDVVVKSSLGTLDGEFGVFQEVAPGMEAGSWLAGVAPKNDDGALSVTEFANLSSSNPALHRQMSVELARKLNQLQWLDILAGQTDRSSRNYMIRMGRNGSVSVKGIDNDQCFPTQMTGVGVYEFDEKELEPFERVFKTLTWVKGKDDGSVVKDTSTKKTSVHLNKFTKEMLNEYLFGGFRNTSIPTYMDRKLHYQVEYWSKHLDGYRNKLRASHLTDRQINAAVSRLLAVKAFGDDLKNRGCMIEDADYVGKRTWGNVKLAEIVDADEIFGSGQPGSAPAAYGNYFSDFFGFRSSKSK